MAFKQKAKILGIVFDPELRFCVYILEAGWRGVATTLVLQRMQVLSPSSARQLFVAIVASVYDYVVMMWMYIARTHSSPSANIMQKIGAQAIMRTFHIMAEMMAEAEAVILSVKQRYDIRMIRIVIEAFILSEDYLLYGLKNLNIKRFALLI